MSLSHSPRIITDGLVLCLDAGNNKSVPKNNILGTWTDNGGNQANYEILGTYSVKLKNTTTGWVGYFPATVSSTGKYVITFTYYSDSNGSTLVLDNDGIMDNTYNTTLTANIAPQTYTGSVDVTTTGSILHYFRRNGGGNIFVTDVSYFKLETTWTDLSGNGNNGTFGAGSAAPTYDSASGGSLSFDGTNDYINCGSAGSLSLGAFTLSAWAKVSSDVSNYRAIIADESPSGPPWNYRLLVSQSSGIVFCDINGGGYGNVSSTFAINNNIWYHVCATRSSVGGALSMYINGVLNNTSTDGSSRSTLANQVWIGQSPVSGGAYPMNGNIAQVQIYNKALTSAEVQQNFNALRGRFGI